MRPNRGYWAKRAVCKAPKKPFIQQPKNATVEIARLFREGEYLIGIERKRREAKHERWRREKDRQRAAKAPMDSKLESLEMIGSWASAKQLEAFFADAERRGRDLPDEQR